MDSHSRLLDVAIVGGGIGGVIALHYARQAGLDALVFEKQAGVGGLWRELPAWQDIQIGLLDWKLGDLPLESPLQPHVLGNIEAWVQRFGLADGILLQTPVHSARPTAEGWAVHTPSGVFRARHLIAASGGHNRPIVPEVPRESPAVREYHSSALRDPAELRGRDVLVVGGGASAFDLLDLSLEHGARRVMWAYRGLRWFLPTGKPKNIAGSVRGFARMQLTTSIDEQNALLRADMRARYAKFGLHEIEPEQDFEVQQDQLIPGRHRMLARFAEIERHRGTVARIAGRSVELTDGASVEADLLLWGTGYAIDLGYIDVPAIAAITSVNELAGRCGGICRSLDAEHLYFPGVFLDGIGSAPFGYALLCRSIASHIRGTATLGREPLAHKVNHFDLVNYLAPRDPANYPPDAWQATWRRLALETPDDQTYPIP